MINNKNIILFCILLLFYFYKSNKTYINYLKYPNHIFWNKGELVYKLVEVHGTREGKTLKTWAFYCEGTQLEEV